MAKVKEIRYVNLANGAIAFGNIYHGLILVDKEAGKKLGENGLNYALLHEAGHIEQETENEFLADAYAFKEFIRLGLPITELLPAMAKSLHDSPQNRERFAYMTERINQYNHAKMNGLNGMSTADVLSTIGNLFGVASQVAGGTSAENQLAIAEAQKEAEATQQRKNISYILAGLAIVAILVLIIIKFR